MDSGPGPIRPASSRNKDRQSYSKPYVRRKSIAVVEQLAAASSSWGSQLAALGERHVGAFTNWLADELEASDRTQSMTNKALSFRNGSKKKASAAKHEEDDGTEDDSNSEWIARPVGPLTRALSSFQQGKTRGPKEIDLWKPDANAYLGLSFEV